MAGSAGYVKLWRGLLDSEQMSDPWLCQLFIWCLLRANYEPTRFRGQDLVAGQFVTGRISASSELKVSASKWYRGIERLQSMRAISILANNHWTTITICNWQTYQETTSEKKPPSNSQRTTDDSTSEQPADTDKESKKGRREEVTRRARTFVKPSAHEVDAYCQERKNGITGEEFVDSYERIGWVIGRNRTPMKDWKAAVRYWELSRKKSQHPEQPKQYMPTYEELTERGYNPQTGMGPR